MLFNVSHKMDQSLYIFINFNDSEEKRSLSCHILVQNFPPSFEFQERSKDPIHISVDAAVLTTPVLLPGSRRQPVVSLIYAVMT